MKAKLLREWIEATPIIIYKHGAFRDYRRNLDSVALCSPKHLSRAQREIRVYTLSEMGFGGNRTS